MAACCIAQNVCDIFHGNNHVMERMSEPDNKQLTIRSQTVPILKHGYNKRNLKKLTVTFNATSVSDDFTYYEDDVGRAESAVLHGDQVNVKPINNSSKASVRSKVSPHISCNDAIESDGSDYAAFNEDVIDTIFDRLEKDWRLALFCETFNCATAGISWQLRNKKKRKVQKAEKQVRDKCIRNLSNVGQGHARRIVVSSNVFSDVKSYEAKKRQRERPKSMKMIDKEKGVSEDAMKKLRNALKKATMTSQKERQNSSTTQTAAKQRSTAASAYELQQHNADKNLPEDIVAFLIEMQNRDLSPEDYDLLLMLDDRIPAKTVNAQVIANIPQIDIDDKLADTLCAVCMEAMPLAEKVKKLTCGHLFHISCIDQWLSTKSTNCPLDGVCVT